MSASSGLYKMLKVVRLLEAANKGRLGPHLRRKLKYKLASSALGKQRWMR